LEAGEKEAGSLPIAGRESGLRIAVTPRKSEDLHQEEHLNVDQVFIAPAFQRRLIGGARIRP
jgi:hypothetical protein